MTFELKGIGGAPKDYQFAPLPPLFHIQFITLPAQMTN